MGALPQSQLAGFMSGARLVITNGGSTLLQAIAGGGACVAVPIARDQIGRIRRCVRIGVAIDAELDAASIVERALFLWNNEQARAALAQRAAGLGLADGIEVAVGALDKLLGST
jgi:UDP:flavonoid glycosyltransferase YjiC (YdhE family)